MINVLRDSETFIWVTQKLHKAKKNNKWFEMDMYYFK